MCRRLRERDDKESLTEVSPYDEHIDRFFNKINDVSDKLADATKKLVSQTRGYAEKNEWNDRVSSVNKEISNYFKRPYQSRTNNWNDELVQAQFWRPFSFFDAFGGGAAETPYGLYSYNSPTTREYSTCVNKKGLSLWDSKGTWRCLFPSSAVPPQFLEYKRNQLADQVLTKEDFEVASSRTSIGSNGAIDLGDKGVFFKQFEDLMKWKNAAYEIEKNRYQTQRETLADPIEKISQDFRRFEPSSEENRTVCVSSGATTRTDPETTEVITTETKTEYFLDGTSVTSTVTKKKAIGASKWETVEESFHRDEDKKGWFWN